MSEPLEGPEAFLPLTAVGPGSTNPSPPEPDAPGPDPVSALLDDDLELDPRPAGHELDLLDDIDPITDDADDDADAVDAVDAAPVEHDDLDTAADDDEDEGDGDDDLSAGPVEGAPSAPGGPRKRRRRGSRGGRGRNRGRAEGGTDAVTTGAASSGAPGVAPAGDTTGPSTVGPTAGSAGVPEAPPVARPPGQPVRRPQIGDTRPAPPTAPAARRAGAPSAADDGEAPRKRRRRGGRGRAADETDARAGEGPDTTRRPTGERPRAGRQPVEMLTGEPLAESDPETLERRRGRERKGRPVGRYLMCVHSNPRATQISVLEGRLLIEHYVSRPQDDANQIDGNIYLGRVQNVLPGMEAAFIDISTPKNAVLYRGDLRFDGEDVESGPVKSSARIEQLLKVGQMILCQVTKNPIAHKGARLTQEVSLPGRFVVFIPNSTTYGISKRLNDDERKRLRRILDDVKPANHGLIVRTAAEGASADELRRDVARLASQWERIEALAARTRGPGLLYREPDLAVRVIREEFNKDYRGVVIDNRELYEDVRDYVASISPELADRVELYDEEAEGLPILERFHIHEQLHKAIDRKVWLPSGGSLIIERTEALTVIDVNTGKNVGTSNLEETVYRNNLEAADEIARQLRLRDIGGIIVIDFIDMEIVANRNDVVRAFRDALARDKTRTQVFDISELGLVEMTRKRVSEGLVESLSTTCPTCEGRGIVFDQELLE